MSERKPTDAADEDFAAMFAASERQAGGAQRPRFAIGDRVRGTIVSIGQEVVVLELAGGGEGTLETLELLGADGHMAAKAGDTIDARVVALGEKQGFVTLRRGAGSGLRGSANLAEAATTGLPVEGVITGVNKGGFEVDVGGTRAFCPLSQIELRPVDDPTAYVGRRLPFRVTRYEEDRRGLNVVLSRRALLEEEARGLAEETRGKVVVGAVLPGVVTAIKDFGAFVDVGGIEGLLPASEISFDRGTRPADVLTVGQPVSVQVMRVEKRDDPKRPEQVSFSLKALERDPWQDAAAQFGPGTTVRGQVMRTEAFGAFVQLAPGVEGLIHISELGAQRPLRHARDAVKPGDPLDVAVLAIEPEKRRISLGLAGREVVVDDEGRAAAARAAGGGQGGQGGKGMGTLGDLLKGKLPGR
jgi:small subunit ribosomal protein S1